jgi:nucleotide-binding universal stress UspA family protein
MKKILVPTDFSIFAQNALEVAADLAVKTKSEILLLHVNERQVFDTPLPEYHLYDRAIEDEYLAMVRGGLAKILDDIAKNGKFASVKIQTSVVDGPLVSVIEKTVNEKGIDLIVMGTKGVSGMEEFLIGSNTEKVIRRVKCPVLTLPSSVKSFKNILFPTTLGDDQLGAFGTLASLQDLFDGEITLLYLNNPRHFANNEAAEVRKEELMKASGLKNGTLYVSATEVFNEEDAILDFADEHRVDLIVMATHQRRGLEHFFLGSMTEDTVNHSHIPVLSLCIDSTSFIWPWLLRRVGWCELLGGIRKK